MIYNNKSSLFAIWIYTKSGEKDTSMISFNKESLMKLKIEAFSQENSYYNKYKNEIFKIEVEPILVYKYKNNSIILIKDLNEMDLSLGNLYATYDYCFSDENKNQNDELREVLVYLSDFDHKTWKESYQLIQDSLLFEKFGPYLIEKNVHYPYYFYETSISLNPILPDILYEEGIMNA